MRIVEEHELAHVTELMRQLRERVMGLLEQSARPINDDECLVHHGEIVIQRRFKA